MKLIKLTTLEGKNILVNTCNIAWVQSAIYPEPDKKDNASNVPEKKEYSIIFFNFLAPRDLSQKMEVSEKLEDILRMTE